MQEKGGKGSTACHHSMACDSDGLSELATVCLSQYVTLLDILPQVDKEADVANKQVYELLQSEVGDEVEFGVNNTCTPVLIKIQPWPLP